MSKGGRASRIVLMGAAALVALTTCFVAASAQKFVESPPPHAATSPADPAAEAPPPGPGTPVPVRLGNHEGFTRIVFDWPDAIDYGVEQRDGVVIIRFRRPARMDLAALTAGTSPAIVHADMQGGVDHTIVRIKTRAGIRVRHFRSGTGVVLDMLDPVQSAKSRLPSTGTPPKPATSEALKTEAKPKDDNPFAAKGPEMGPRPRRPMPVADSTSAAAKGRPVAGTKAPEKSTSANGAKTPKIAAVKPNRLDGAAPAQPRRLEAHQAAPGDTSLSGIPVALSLEAREAVLRFHWGTKVGAAVFVRGGHLWAVFDRQSAMTFEGWEKRHEKRDRRMKWEEGPRPVWAGSLGDPQASKIPGHTVFRMRIPKGVGAKVRKEEETWIVTLDQEIAPPVTGIPVEPQFLPVAGARLSLTVPNAGQAAAIRDPEAGDLVWVVPVMDAGKGIGLSRTFAEVKLLATAQGIAGRAMRDGVVFKTTPQGVEITAPGGLNLSGTTTPGASKQSPPATTSAGARRRQGWLFDIGKLYQPTAAAFTRASHRLLEAAYEAQPANQSRARLRLAQLYFAHGRYSDAAGILQVIEADEPQFVDDPVFRALRGASYLFRGDLKRARLDLFHANLDPYSEISLWRGAVEAEQGNWAAASRLFSRSETIIGVYPRSMRIRFGLLVAETALHVGDVALTKYHLETVQALKPGRAFQPRLDFLHGQLLALTLDPEGAIEYWNKAIEGPDPKYRVYATLARTQSQLKHNKITLNEATKELEKIRYAWRGDELEFRVLSRLGSTYLKAGDYKNGLLALRDAVRFYPNDSESDAVIDRMRAAFIKLYVDGKADELPPLVSLALYDEFRELTPPGKAGNDLIAKLARRLVDVDLLDRSARLLKHLVDERLTGTERLQAANQLGLVYLLDRKPDLALETLDGKLPADLAPKIATTRRHLRARALGELARFKEALQLLKGDTSRDALMLRAEISWRLKNWAAAAKAYQGLIGLTREKGKGEGKEKTRQRYILSLAISLALSGDVPGLNKARKRFSAEMAKGRYREAFNLVSGHSGPVPSSYKVITQKVAEVDLFETFMKTYRAKLLPTLGNSAKTQAKASPAKG